MVKKRQFGLFFASVVLMSFVTEVSAGDCGDVVDVKTKNDATLRYAYGAPTAKSERTPAVTTLVLLAGGGGNLNLDDNGCAREMAGNFLIRSISLFRALGFGVAWIDAPSNYQGEEGLGGYRKSPKHAADLAQVVEDLRTRYGGQVWVVGTSRGTISATNVTARAADAGAPNGVVLTSILTVGNQNPKRPWVADTVFDLPLESIRVPALLIGHADDACMRSPPENMQKVAARLSAARRQIVTVTGGSVRVEGASRDLKACEGRTPHGFVSQEKEVVDGIARFIVGGEY